MQRKRATLYILTYAYRREFFAYAWCTSARFSCQYNRVSLFPQLALVQRNDKKKMKKKKIIEKKHIKNITHKVPVRVFVRFYIN